MKNVSLLDCTLRDGGYINDWNFGFNTIKKIIKDLIAAKVEFIEVGFLRNDLYNENCTIFNNCKQIERILPEERKETKFVAMALHNKYDINKLEPYDGKTIEAIRVTFHDYDIQEGLAFAKKVKEKGYKVFCNPINIMGYSDENIIKLVYQINEIEPYGFSIVDTFGAAMMSDLARIYYLVNHNLKSNIVLGLHLHENLSLAYSLAQNFIGMAEGRKCIIDASLLGMGREPGNLCMELMVDYMDRIYGYNYDMDPLLDAIDDYIAPLKEKYSWGYNIAYALSAKYNLHRNYAEFLLGKGRLRAKQINYILSEIDESKKTTFDEKYVEKLFIDYQNIAVNDQTTIQKLKEMLEGKEVLILAPGLTIETEKEKIKEQVANKKIFTIAANFDGGNYTCDCWFFSNIVRFENIVKEIEPDYIFVTSNLMHNDYPFENVLNYMDLVEDEFMCDNCVIMILRLLFKMGISEVMLAGFDGFNERGCDYAEKYTDMYEDKNRKMKRQENDKNNKALEILNRKMRIKFLTSSIYS